MALISGLCEEVRRREFEPIDLASDALLHNQQRDKLQSNAASGVSYCCDGND